MKMKKGKAKGKGTSAPQNTAVGSGSRPGTKSRHPIMSSAPKDQHHLDRSGPMR